LVELSKLLISHPARLPGVEHGLTVTVGPGVGVAVTVAVAVAVGVGVAVSVGVRVAGLAEGTGAALRAQSLSPVDTTALGVREGEAVSVATNRGTVVLPAQIDAKLLPGHVWMPNGFGMRYPGVDGGLVMQGANQNELTDIADRDPITDIPHHRYVRCRLEAVHDDRARRILAVRAAGRPWHAPA
jgi:hypothetical protein